MFTTKEILDIALKIEQNGEAVYRKATRELVDPDLTKRLLWMADEEACHAEWFRNLQSNLSTQKDSIAVDEMNSDILRDLIGEQSFTLQDIDFPGLDDMQNLMDIFIEFIGVKLGGDTLAIIVHLYLDTFPEIYIIFVLAEKGWY